MPMRRKYQKRRNYRKKRAGFRAKKRSGLRRINSSNQGYMNVNRRLPFISAQAGNLLGLMTVTDPTSSCLALGTPTAVPGAISGLYDIPFSLGFQLDQLVGYTEFTNLFDHYRINTVRVDLKTFPNSTLVTGVGIPWVEFWTDHDNALPTPAATAREIMGVKSSYFSGNKVMTKMYVKPRPLVEVATADGTPAPGALRTHTWLNCTDIDVPHYGIKGVLHNVYLGGTSGQNQFQFDIHMNASFKGVQ